MNFSNLGFLLGEFLLQESRRGMLRLSAVVAVAARMFARSCCRHCRLYTALLSTS